MQTTSEGEPELLFERARWLDIAIALSDRDLTLAECAQRLGVEAGVIYRPLHAMREAGLLEASGGEIGRGTRYWLRPDLIDRLEQEIRRRQPLGVALEGQLVCMIEADSLLALANALSASDLSRAVVWVAELDSGDRFLAVLDGEVVSSTLRNRLRGAVEGAGGEYRVGVVSNIVDAATWRRSLAAIRDAAQ